MAAMDVQDAVTPQTSIFLSDVETDVWPKGTVARLAALSNRFVVTRGELGADVFSSDNTTFHFDAEKVDIDPALFSSDKAISHTDAEQAHNQPCCVCL